MNSVQPSPLFSGMLLEYGAVTRAALFDMLPDKEPHRYHYDLMSEYPHRGGRMLRAAVCLATARAFGGRIDQTLRCAVSVEMLHDALMIHGDVADGNERRRGRPALHRVLGEGLAINAGDSLTLLSLRPLIACRRSLGPRLTLRILDETQRMLREYAEGQAQELGWRRDAVLDPGAEAYLGMVLKRTGWIHFIHPARLGALVATRDSIDLDRFIAFGFFAGAAYQIREELRNLLATPAGEEPPDDGRGLADDLWSGHRSFPLMELLRCAGKEDRSRLTEILRRPREERTADDIAWIRLEMDRSGAVERTRRLARDYVDAAFLEFRRVYGDLPESRDKRFLEDLLIWLGRPPEAGDP